MSRTKIRHVSGTNYGGRVVEESGVGLGSDVAKKDDSRKSISISMLLFSRFIRFVGGFCES